MFLVEENEKIVLKKLLLSVDFENGRMVLSKRIKNIEGLFTDEEQDILFKVYSRM